MDVHCIQEGLCHRTFTRWAFATVIVAFLCVAMIVGTYINATLGGPSTITMQETTTAGPPPSDAPESQPWFGPLPRPPQPQQRL